MQQALHSHQGHLPAGGGWPLQLDNGGPLTACLRDAILQILRGLPVSHDASVGAPLEEAPVDIPLQTKEEISESQRQREAPGFAEAAGAGVAAAAGTDATAATEEWLFSKLHEIEAERDKTRQRLRQQEIATREAQQKYIEHRDRASTLAQRVVHDLKERRLMSNQLAEVEQKLLEERETRRRLEADKKNLSRTIARLRGKLEEAKSELATARLEAGLIDSERQRAEQQTEVFRHNIKGMGDLQRNLTEELAEARERVSSVKRAFREKIGQLQSEHEEWRKIIESHQQTVKHWEDKYQESQAQVEAAHGSMDRLREHMDQLQIFASDLAAEKEETHTQLRKQIQLNEQLQAELTEVTEQLLLQDQKRKQQQQKWRQEHLSAVDRKTEARKFALKFTEAAVQADAASSRSDDTPADTPGPHNSKAPPSLGPPKGCWVRND